MRGGPPPRLPRLGQWETAVKLRGKTLEVHCRIPKFFRGDSAFAGPKLLRLLEKEGYRYAIRLKTNTVLERKIAPLLKRPVGRPSRKPKVSAW
jgi:Transposase DDE domain group 1